MNAKREVRMVLIPRLVSLVIFIVLIPPSPSRGLELGGQAERFGARMDLLPSHCQPRR